MSISAPAAPMPRPTLTSLDLGLYGATVFAWGFSWIVIKGQIGDVAPEVSVFWRFVLAALVMFGWSWIRGHQLKYPLKDHAKFLGLGVLIFSTNFTLFYYGSAYLPSGLVAVVFSIASTFNILLAFLLFAQRPALNVVIAGVMGICGIALMFWPEIMGTTLNANALEGLMLCGLGTLSFCLGNMVSAKAQGDGIAVIPASAWGMAYGAGFIGCFALLRGQSFDVPLDPLYLGSLVYLAVIASVIAFGSYLTLLGRIGSAKAGYATVIFPVVALAVSTVVENYQWSALAIGGVVLVLCGNVLMLRR